MEEAGSHYFYMGYQIIASLLFAVICIAIGLFLAWIIWGKYKDEVEKVRAESRGMKEELKKLS